MLVFFFINISNDNSNVKYLLFTPNRKVNWRLKIQAIKMEMMK